MTETQSDFDILLQIPDPAPSPECLTIMGDLWRGLGGDAKAVLDLLLDFPPGLTFEGDLNRISLTRVKFYLSREWAMPARRIRTAFREIRGYVNDLNEIY